MIFPGHASIRPDDIADEAGLSTEKTPLPTKMSL